MSLTATSAILVALFLAINMGASGTAPSMATAYGSGVIGRKSIPILFGLFVFIGALVGSGAVIKTISKGLISPSLIDLKVALIIFLSAGLSIFIANLLRIPQSTSQSTIFAIIGIGLYYHSFNKATFAFMVPIWFILPALAFFSSYTLERIGYNWIISKITKRHKVALKIFVIATCCYVAFAIGTNNVANAVGPMVGAKIIGQLNGILLIAPLISLITSFLLISLFHG